MNPEDPKQFDALASKLSAMQPASAIQLQALAFYTAGKRAATSRSAPALWKLRSLAVSLALAIVCSTVAYYAGSQRSGPLNSDISDNLAVVDLAQPNSPPASASVKPDVAQHEPIAHEPIAHEPSEQQVVELKIADGGKPAHSDSYARSVAPLLVSWLQLPHRDAEEYLRSVELRTRPQLSSSAGIAESSDTTQPTSRSAASFDRQLPELDRFQLESPLRRLLSM